jgi:hypothetical protein
MMKNTVKHSNNINSDGYPLYPVNEDVYSKLLIDENIDPDDISTLKKPIKKQKQGERNEKDFDEDHSGIDLDVPGSELDDEDEAIGEEDEENNYYSLGGDMHNDLDESME